MRRTCERPGCSAPVAVIYGCSDESGTLHIWLDSWSPDRTDGDWPHDARGLVCEHHSQLLSAPRGWELVDRRETVPRLFRPRPVLVRSREHEEARRADDDSAALRRRRVAALPAPQLFSDSRAEDQVEERSQVELQHERVDQSQVDGPAGEVRAQEANAHEDLTSLLDATGPLLRRAFAKGNTGRRDASKELMRPTTHPVVDESA